MLFNSYEFLFLFLPVTLAGFFLARHGHRVEMAGTMDEVAAGEA